MQRPDNLLRFGSGGNPYLKPFKSTNFDASLEYYFSPTGFASVGVFHRDIKGFIATKSFSYPDPTTPGVTLVLSGPVNTSKGKMDGLRSAGFHLLRLGLGAQFGPSISDRRERNPPQCARGVQHPQQPRRQSAGARSVHQCAARGRVEVGLQRHRHV